MTFTRPAAPPEAAARTEVATRQLRRSQRRRAVRERWLVAAVLLVAFLVTVVLLGLQWLHAPQVGGVHSAAGLVHHFPVSEAT